MASLRILYVTATRAEWQGACGVYGEMPPREQCIHNFTSAGGVASAVLVTGVGPVNAAMALGKELEGARGADLVLNIGLAGSFDLELAPLCSHWRVVRESYAEYGIVREGQCADAHALGFPQWEGEREGDGSGQNVWQSVDLDAPVVHPVSDSMLADLPLRGSAHAITAAGVTVCPLRAAALRERFAVGSAARPMPLLENMEGFALALVCARYGLPFVQVRTVSNAVGERARGSFDFQGALASLGEVVQPLLCA